MAYYKDLKPGSRYRKTPAVGRYRVQRGDSLWEIARLAYGHGEWWEQIAEWNKINRKRPLLIGQSIVIPVPRQASHYGPDGHVLAPHEVDEHGVYDPHGALAYQNNPGSHDNHRLAREFKDGPFREARPVLFPAFKYELEGLTLVQDLGFVIYTLRFKGEVALQRNGVITGGLSFTKEGIESEYKKEADGAFKDLFTKSTVTPGREGVGVSLAMGSVIKSGSQVLATTELTVVSPIEVKYTCKGQEIRGNYQEFEFGGLIGYEITIITKPQLRQEVAPKVVSWKEIVGVSTGVLMLVGVAALAVGDGIKDVGSGGTGLVETPITFAIALALYGRAIEKIKGSEGKH